MRSGKAKEGDIIDRKNKKVCRMFGMLFFILLIFRYPAYANVQIPGKVTLLGITSSSCDRVTIKWKKTTNATEYRIYRKENGKWKGIKRVSSSMSSYTDISSRTYPIEPGKTYTYTVRAYNKKSGKYGSYNKVGLMVQIPEKKKEDPNPTIKKLLQTALLPVGRTMYVWGGGWNEEDTAAGREAKTIGVSAKWEEFFLKQNSSYNYQNTRYQIHNGLDCSGYVGWCIYNLMNTKSGNDGYVMYASKMASDFAARGWGTYLPSWEVADYKPGDIMSSAGHVYIVVGSCSDGSIVLMHASPPGVMISGTTTRSGNKNSQAIQLASSYMKKYYPKWYAKYPDSSRGTSYFSGYGQMRWKITVNSVVKDPEGYQKMNAQQVLKDLFTSV